MFLDQFAAALCSGGARDLCNPPALETRKSPFSSVAFDLESFDIIVPPGGCAVAFVQIPPPEPVL